MATGTVHEGREKTLTCSSEEGAMIFTKDLVKQESDGEGDRTEEDHQKEDYGRTEVADG